MLMGNTMNPEACLSTAARFAARTECGAERPIIPPAMIVGTPAPITSGDGVFVPTITASNITGSSDIEVSITIVSGTPIIAVPGLLSYTAGVALSGQTFANTNTDGGAGHQLHGDDVAGGFGHR